MIPSPFDDSGRAHRSDKVRNSHWDGNDKPISISGCQNHRAITLLSWNVSPLLLVASVMAGEKVVKSHDPAFTCTPLSWLSVPAIVTFTFTCYGVLLPSLAFV